MLRGWLTAAMLALAWPAQAVQPGEAAPAVPALQGLQGKLVYLDFWASWCGPCKQSFPWMNAIQAKYADAGLVVVAVNVDANRADADRFLKSVPAQFQIAYDAKGVAPAAFAIKGMPSSVLIGRDGKVLATHAGFNDATRDKMEAEIAAAVKGQP